MPEKKVAIIGATGFTGSELVRLLLRHPKAEISVITSESRKGEPFSDVHPFFEGVADFELCSVNDPEVMEADIAFLALPHGVSMSKVGMFVKEGIPVIDLSGDFRLSTPDVYEEWYGKSHTYTQGFDNAVYGLPELFGEHIPESPIVANPGCYPTSVILAVSPLLRNGLVHPSPIIADSKSGVTGAGVKAKPVNHFSAVNDNFRAYGLKHHRHTIEIQEKLNIAADDETSVLFTPHLLPVDRGILSTIYLEPASDITDETISDAYADAYSECPFVRLRKAPPSIKEVRGTNYCDIYATYDKRTRKVIVISAIDNLVKGAAGQAIQNMNLLFNWEETAGLQQLPLSP